MSFSNPIGRPDPNDPRYRQLAPQRLVNPRGTNLGPIQSGLGGLYMQAPARPNDPGFGVTFGSGSGISAQPGRVPRAPRGAGAGPAPFASARPPRLSPRVQRPGQAVALLAQRLAQGGGR